jgi:hypothetical protein
LAKSLGLFQKRRGRCGKEKNFLPLIEISGTLILKRATAVLVEIENLQHSARRIPESRINTEIPVVKL